MYNKLFHLHHAVTYVQNKTYQSIMFLQNLKLVKQETDIYTARRVGLTFDSQKLKVNIALPYGTVFLGKRV